MFVKKKNMYRKLESAFDWLIQVWEQTGTFHKDNVFVVYPAPAQWCDRRRRKRRTVGRHRKGQHDRESTWTWLPQVCALRFVCRDTSDLKSALFHVNTIDRDIDRPRDRYIARWNSKIRTGWSNDTFPLFQLCGPDVWAPRRVLSGHSVVSFL